jgi:hypothetical protein
MEDTNVELDGMRDRGQVEIVAGKSRVSREYKTNRDGLDVIVYSLARTKGLMAVSHSVSHHDTVSSLLPLYAL